MKKIALFLFAVCLFAEERVDLTVVNKIRAEAFERSKIGEYMFNLADVYAPRVTNSENYRKGGEWVLKQLQEMGLSNVKKESWGPYGRGWEYSY
jgi:carboxypeptidase Q